MDVLPQPVAQELAYALKSVGFAGFVAGIATNPVSLHLWRTLVSATAQAVVQNPTQFREAGSNLVQEAFRQKEEEGT